MHLYNLIIVVCLLLTVSAKDHRNATAAADGKKGGGKHAKNNNSELAKCAAIRRLSSLTELVNNSTKLAEFEANHQLTADDMQKLKDKAANATAKLADLKSNATLVNACVTIDANAKTMAECRVMERLQKFVQLENNSTALGSFLTKHNLTDIQTQKIKDEIANATSKLATLQSNSTLVAACKNVKTSGGSSGSGGLISASTSRGIRSFGITFDVFACLVFAAFLGGFTAFLA